MSTTFKLFVVAQGRFEVIYKIPEDVYDKFTHYSGGYSALDKFNKPDTDPIDIELFQKCEDGSISLGKFTSYKTPLKKNFWGILIPTAEEHNDNRIT